MDGHPSHLLGRGCASAPAVGTIQPGRNPREFHHFTLTSPLMQVLPSTEHLVGPESAKSLDDPGDDPEAASPPGQSTDGRISALSPQAISDGSHNSEGGKSPDAAAVICVDETDSAVDTTVEGAFSVSEVTHEATPADEKETSWSVQELASPEQHSCGVLHSQTGSEHGRRNASNGSNSSARSSDLRSRTERAVRCAFLYKFCRRGCMMSTDAIICSRTRRRRGWSRVHAHTAKLPD